MFLFVCLLDELESGALRADDAADLRLGDLLGGTTYYFLLIGIIFISLGGTTCLTLLVSYRPRSFYGP